MTSKVRNMFSLPSDKTRAEAARGPTRPPIQPHVAQMTARSAGPDRLLSRVEHLVEQQLEQAIEGSGWKLHDTYDLPECDDEDCQRCTGYFNHIAAAERGMEVEDFEKKLDEKKKKDDEETDDEETDDEEEDGQLNDLFQLVYLRARQKAQDLDHTDPAARGRIEGILAEMYHDKDDALRERDNAFARATVAQLKVDTMEAENKTLSEDRERVVAERDADRLRVAALEERLRQAEEENSSLRSNRELPPSHAALITERDAVSIRAAGLEEKLRQAWEANAVLQADRLRAGVFEEKLQFEREEKAKMQQTLDLERSTYRKKLEGLLFSADEGDEPVRPGKRRRTTIQPRGTQKVAVTKDFANHPSRRPSNMGIPPPNHPSSSFSATSENRKNSKPTPHDRPEQMAEWLQSNPSNRIQGIPVVDGAVNLRDVRGYQQVMARAGSKQRGRLAPAYLRGLFAIIRLLAVPGLYAEMLQAADAQIAPVPDMSMCAFADGNYTDADVPKLLAQKGLTIQIADDSWQFCFNFLEAEAKKATTMVDREEVFGALQRARQRLSGGPGPPGLFPRESDLYTCIHVPKKGWRR